MMHTDWFISFIEAARLGSLSKAAEQLNLTQPAISKHIRNLEDSLGAGLFRRGSGGVSLTDEGRLLLERILPVVDQIQAIKDELGPKEGKADRMIVGCLPSIASRLLPAGLKSVHQAGNSITVYVKNSSEELLQALSDGACDAVLADMEFCRGPWWRKALFEERFKAVVPERHGIARKASVELAELSGDSFMFASPRCDSRRRVEQLMSAFGEYPRIVGEADSADYIFGVIESGTGVTVVPELVALGADRYKVAVVPIRDPQLQRTVGIAARTAKIGAKLYRLLSGSVPLPDKSEPFAEAH